MLGFIGGPPLDPESITACFLFDPKSGRIVHRHEVVNFPGATRLEARQIESEAYRLAAVQGYNVSELKALLLSSGDYSTAKCYRVDTSTLRLVEVPRPSFS